MTVILEIETEDLPKLEYEKLANLVAEAVLDQEECPYEASVNLLISDNENIHRVNKEFRGIDRPTDVLSFPSVPFIKPVDYDILEEDDSLFDMETGELLLGDIMISADKIREQALEYGHSEKREFCFLLAHSMLHLLGYDHMEAAEAAVMEEKQRQVMDKLGITR